MATKILLYALLPFFFSLHSTLSASPPYQPPAPSPADSPLLSPPHPSPSPSPSPSPHTGSPLLPPSDSPVPSFAPSVSPPAPPPSDLVPPGASPSPANSPVPAPTGENDADVNNVEAEEKKDSSGLSGGKKAGIAVGVLAAVCLVGLGGLVYKKRQDNIRRSQYGYAARRELL